MSLAPRDLDLVPPTDPSLNQSSDAVEPADIGSAEIQGVINRMLDLAAGKGHSKHDTRQMVGLAAPQLGCHKRIIAIDVTADGSHKDQNLRVLINPVITHHAAETLPGREGCWSCGNICGNVERFQAVTIKALDRDGHAVELELTDFVARIAQHEVDHLDGIRFPDRIPQDQPEKLHWVKPEEFPDYRLHWATWANVCPRDRWLKMKRGEQ